MKKDILGPAAVFLFALATFPASLVFSSPDGSKTTLETTQTLQMIAPYRSWGKANLQPIVLSIDSIDLGG